MVVLKGDSLHTREFSERVLASLIGKQVVGFLKSSGSAAISVADAAFEVGNLRLDANGDLVGDMVYLDTPCAKLLKAASDEGVSVVYRTHHFEEDGYQFLWLVAETE